MKNQVILAIRKNAKAMRRIEKANLGDREMTGTYLEVTASLVGIGDFTFEEQHDPMLGKLISDYIVELSTPGKQLYSQLSLHNGNEFFGINQLDSIHDSIQLYWDAIVGNMDDSIREFVHLELAPCTDITFLKRYLELAPEDLIIG